MTDPRIRPLEPGDLEAADRVMRVAFGTHLGAADPLGVFGDTETVRTRFAADPEAAFCAELDGELVGSAFVARWGSFGFFGPLTVRVDRWDQGIAGRLLVPVVELLERWEVRHAGLFTFPESPKHLALYRKFGFWPRQLTAILARPLDAGAPAASYGTYGEARRAGSAAEALAACREVSGSVYDGLDLEREIVAADEQELGDTLLVWDTSSLAAFAVCHVGAGTEAGTGRGYVKFGAARAGAGAPGRFARLLAACEAFAADRGASAVTAGVNLARRGAYRALLERGYRAERHGVLMLRPDAPAYDREDAYVLDDLR